MGCVAASRVTAVAVADVKMAVDTVTAATNAAVVVAAIAVAVVKVAVDTVSAV